MTHQTFNNKRIFWESKTKQVVLVIISFLFVAVALWTRDKSSTLIFWLTLILFGGGGLFLLFRLLNSKNLFVTHNSELGKTIVVDQFKKAQEDLGFFNYNDTGFSLTKHNAVETYNWTDIETVFGFKEDRFTTDEICLDIFTNSKLFFRVTESTPGWYQFIKRLSENIASIPLNWDKELVLPPFATNLTLLFDKKGRTKEHTEAECYKE